MSPSSPVFVGYYTCIYPVETNAPLIPCVCRILYLYLPCRYKKSLPLVLVGYYTYIYPCVCRILYLYLPCRNKCPPHPLCL